MNRRILLVDDDINVLKGFERQLRQRFQVATALSGDEGLETAVKKGPFAVIVSDMQMPKMNGIQFLYALRTVAPDSVRIMLTGNADQNTAMKAVNDGHIFRFLTKPCPPEVFSKALEAGIEQYRLITAERELLSKTLSGSVSILSDVLSLVNPKAFGHKTSIRHLVRQVCQELQVDNAWEIEIAAMLSQIGCITIPETTLDKLSRGAPLSPEELQTYQGHPQVGYNLISKIPRLKRVAEIIAYQQKCFDGSGVPDDGKHGNQIPLGARVLKLAIDVVQLISVDQTTQEIWDTIYVREGWYDPALFDALAAALDVEYVIKSVEIKQLEENMILDEHVRTKSGELLVARGQEVTLLMREKLMKFTNTIKGVLEPIQVRCLISRSDSNLINTLERDLTTH